MSDANGAKPQLDPALLTSNDLRRLKAALDGLEPAELLAGDSPDLFQVMILAWKLRDDPAYTWEQAGDVPVGSVFDMSGGGQSPPETPPPAEPSTKPKRGTGRTSKPKPAASEPAPSSAASTALTAPSTTS